MLKRLNNVLSLQLQKQSLYLNKKLHNDIYPTPICYYEMCAIYTEITKFVWLILQKNSFYVVDI